MKAHILFYFVAKSVLRPLEKNPITEAQFTQKSINLPVLYPALPCLAQVPV